jgi:hypothetical protein
LDLETQRYMYKFFKFTMMKPSPSSNCHLQRLSTIPGDPKEEGRVLKDGQDIFSPFIAI